MQDYKHRLNDFHATQIILVLLIIYDWLSWYCTMHVRIQISNSILVMIKWFIITAIAVFARARRMNPIAEIVYNFKAGDFLP